MPEFHELVEMMRNPGEDGLPSDFADQLTAAHDAMVNDFTSAAADMTERLTAADVARQAAESAKRAAQEQNVRMLRSMPVKTPEKDSAEVDSGGEGQSPDDGQTTIDSLIDFS